MMTREVVIVEALRTPIGKYNGTLRAARPDDLAAHVLRALVERTGIDPADVDDVYLGNANGAGEDNRNVARMAALLAGFPVEVPGATVNRLCGSGLQAIVTGAREIQVGAADIVIAGGVESMTRAPYVMPKPEIGFQRGAPEIFDTTLGWRMVNPALAERYPPISLGMTAENVARDHEVSREAQDRFALRSQQRAIAAQDVCRFSREVVPIEALEGKGTAMVSRDEGPRRDTSLEKLARLQPAFLEGGTVTAGNSSGINDGAAALLLMSREAAERAGLPPLARFVDAAVAGVDPAYMGMGPVPATKKLLARTGLSISDLDVVELNEAFASQAVACIRELGFDEDRVNPNGGSIALGHPLGASGARLAGTLVHELRRTGGGYGLVTMCIGVGQGISALFERVAA
jgi:3-oxoadipyl-CoA thiolase